jgi:hypothetical protein
MVTTFECNSLSFLLQFPPLGLLFFYGRKEIKIIQFFKKKLEDFVHRARDKKGLKLIKKT